MHPPLEQSTSHVAPLGHDTEQLPLEQPTLHGTFSEQTIKHFPLEQSSVQLFVESHVSLQLPLEQPRSHALLPLHEPSHPPLEQSHEPAEQSTVLFEPGARGSGSDPDGCPDDPQATKTATQAKAEAMDRMRKSLW